MALNCTITLPRWREKSLGDGGNHNTKRRIWWQIFFKPLILKHLFSIIHITWEDDRLVYPKVYCIIINSLYWRKMYLYLSTCRWAKISFRSPISSQWVASPFHSLVFTDSCHVTMKRQDRGRAWHRCTHPHPRQRDRRIERCSWSLRSSAHLISPLYPLFSLPGTMRLRADVTCYFCPSLVREWGGHHL